MYFSPWSFSFICYALLDSLCLVYVCYNINKTRNLSQSPGLYQVVVGMIALSLLFENVRITLGGFITNLESSNIICRMLILSDASHEFGVPMIIYPITLAASSLNGEKLNDISNRLLHYE